MKTWNFINGWSLKIARVNRVMLLGVAMTTLNQQSYAANKQTQEEQTPSIEFLEFLGGGVTVEQEFLDPMNYSEIATETQQDTKKQVETKKMDKDDK